MWVMTEKPAREEIEELVRRLQTDSFPLAHIQEAGEILASVHTPIEAYQMGLDFALSTHEQVRTLGLAIMESLAPKLEAAKGFLSGAKDAARLLSRSPEADKPAKPDYSAIGAVIKAWLRDGRDRRRG
jgi:hypothetical protein